MTNTKSVNVEHANQYSFAANGSSTTTNSMGMREMQERAYAQRNSQYLLIKAPPASGKSRALMYIALDKLYHQGLSKVIIAVPQMVIGSSFKSTVLKSSGFFENWEIDDSCNLCTAESEKSKVTKFLNFLDSTPSPTTNKLLCTHATLVAAFKKLSDQTALSKLDNVLLAIDEFHHSSAKEDNQLGFVIHTTLNKTNAHMVAMTGSYFRGDRTFIMEAQDEGLFDEVTYTYYEQLNGYHYLKTLGIDYAFYTGRWQNAIAEVLDTHKKTIIHLPYINSNESSKDKENDVGLILDFIVKGNPDVKEASKRDSKTGLYFLKTADGRTLKVANLVDDGPQRADVVNYLKTHTKREDIDIIIALNMAKEGFDWPWCEHVLTIGYRQSLTEVVQIIGRATRDCEGKTHAQFTNLIRRPDAEFKDVQGGVNNLLKAITLSLLMEQVLLPNVRFRSHSDSDAEQSSSGGIIIEVDEGERPLSKKAKEILKNGLDTEITKVINSIPSNPELENLVFSNDDVEYKIAVLTKVLSENLHQANEDLSDNDVEVLAQNAVRGLQIAVWQRAQQGGLALPPLEPQPDSSPAQSATSATNTKTAQEHTDSPRAEATHAQNDSSNAEGEASTNTGSNFRTTYINPEFAPLAGSNGILKMSDYLNVTDIDLNLIASIDPFAGAYSFISKHLDAPMLKNIQNRIQSKRNAMSEKEALDLYPFIKKFVKEYGYEPRLDAIGDYEQRLALALKFLRQEAQKKRQLELSGSEA